MEPAIHRHLCSGIVVERGRQLQSLWYYVFPLAVLLLLLLVCFGASSACGARTISAFLLAPHTGKHNAESRGESWRREAESLVDRTTVNTMKLEE